MLRGDREDYVFRFSPHYNLSCHRFMESEIKGKKKTKHKHKDTTILRKIHHSYRLNDKNT